jgi:TRAP-type mannitol/chloroaromatic compound transport system permease large subunit
VSVVQLYAGAFFPGLMLAGLYVLYVIVLAKIKPNLMPPLSAEQRFVPLPAPLERISQGVSNLALPGLLRGGRVANAEPGFLRRQLSVVLMPAIVFLLVAGLAWHINTRPAEVVEVSTMVPSGQEAVAEEQQASAGGLAEPPAAGSGVKEPAGADSGVKEPPSADSGVKEPPGAAATADGGVKEPGAATATTAAPAAAPERTPATTGYWIGAGVGAIALAALYALLTFQRLEIFKMLLASFFPLVILILSVLGSIVMGLATPTEAAAVGAFGGYLLAAVYGVINKHAAGRGGIFALWLLLWTPALASIGWFILKDQGAGIPPVPMLLGTAGAVGVLLWAILAYRQAKLEVAVKESVLLTAKTSAMVCWLFVGSAIFSAAFALLGGQDLVEKWVMSMNLTKTQFLILSQVIIFILGWPLEWTEIIVIFMPIFIPLLDNFGVDPLFFGLLVALNLQTAFLSPPVAMAAFYLKGVSPPHVTLNQIFAGMLPFMGIQVVAIVLLYNFPAIGMWLPQVLYGR